MLTRHPLAMLCSIVGDIETSIVVPGAFTSGTNHFAHAGSPADKGTPVRIPSTTTVLYAHLGDDIMKGFAATAPADVHRFEILPVVLNYRFDEGASVSALQSHYPSRPHASRLKGPCRSGLVSL
jgi:hypothetical protein